MFICISDIFDIVQRNTDITSVFHNPIPHTPKHRTSHQPEGLLGHSQPQRAFRSGSSVVFPAHTGRLRIIFWSPPRGSQRVSKFRCDILTDYDIPEELEQVFAEENPSKFQSFVADTPILYSLNCSDHFITSPFDSDFSDFYTIDSTPIHTNPDSSDGHSYSNASARRSCCTDVRSEAAMRIAPIFRRFGVPVQ